MTAPLSGMTGPETSAAEQSRMELQAKLNGLGGLNGRKLDPEAKAKKLREACEGFESIFIQKMWQEMRNSVPKTGLLSGREERFWQDMYDQELSKSMTKAGGIGLADMMFEQLSRNLVSASRSAAGSVTGAAFTPGAAPLVPQEMEDALGPEALAASIYDGEAEPEGQLVGDNQTGKSEPAGQQAPQVSAQPAQAQAQARNVAETVQTANQAAQAGAVQTAPAQPAPLTAEAKPEAVASAVKPVERKHAHKADLGQSSGLLQAQKAKREAGDKLGSRAVRPSSQKRQQQAEQTPQEPVFSGLTQTGDLRPGSAEALRAAVEMAKTGATGEITSQPLNLAGLVANVQAMNSQAAQTQTAIQTGQNTDAAEPVVRKVRYSTNVPKKAANSKDAKQAIRMLNVDNVGVNSKQGKGLAAYHAQQEAAQASQPAQQSLQAPQASQPAQAPQAGQPLAANAVIPPLTAQSQPAPANDGNFAIPPLTAADSRG